MKNSRTIVILGCGRLGAYLAIQLSRSGDSVVVIDRDETAFDSLSADFSGFRILGDGTHMQVLRKAGVEKADIFISTTDNDNVNVMTAQVARKIFDVPQVLARVLDPKREEIFTQLGIDAICTTTLSAHVFLQTIANGPEKPKGARS
ncbi:TrkA-N domain protein [uncultured Desulfatiglans sp.]|uniref:TrkA-N domain protein n=1 Tax=Uncultured Desulfatiglans sp. TaxID=1748965 RepID=A0A653AC16_UNCDX|nr:TrkA-N domain protein [uncultured Desulfatiglans sp.]